MTDPNFFTSEQLVALMRRFFRFSVGEGEQVAEGCIILPQKGKKNRKIFTDGDVELIPVNIVLSGKKLLGYHVDRISRMCLMSKKKNILRAVRSSDGRFTVTAEKKDGAGKQYVLTSGPKRKRERDRSSYFIS